MEQRSRPNILVTTFLAVSAAVAVGMTSLIPAHASDEPIRIGAFTATTGGASFLGDPQEKTLRLYVDKINAAGGVLGRKLQLFIYDSAGDARQAVTYVRRLIEDDKVDVIVGGTTTGETMAVIPMVEEAQIPFISFAGGNVVVEPVRKWVFKTPGSDRMAVSKIYTDMKARGFSRAALISGDGGFDQSCRKEALAVAKKMDVTVVADETYAQADTDMTPQFSRIGSAKPDAVVSCGFGVAAVIVIRNFRQVGLKSPIYFTHGVGAQQFVDGARGAAEGARIVVSSLPVADQLAENDPQREVALAYTNEYKAKYGEAPAAFGGFAYDALHLVKAAMERAKATDKAAVRDELEKTSGFVGINGIFNMTPQDHMGLDFETAFKLTEIRDSAWHLVK
jgi:branched-chain amino acid transport system substrate-binding protein